MHLGIFAKTFVRPTLEETLDAVASHGLTHVQFNMSCAGLPTLPDRIDEDLCVWIARLLKDRGITMAAISGTFNLCDPDAGRLEENLRRLDVLAAACRWLDTRIITLCTGTRDPDDMWRWHPENVRRSTWETLVAAARKAVKIADRQEVTLAFEPEIHNVVNSVSKARGLLDEIDSPWLKVVIDPANLIGPCDFGRVPEILDEVFDWLGSDIVLAHAKEPTLDDDAARFAITTRLASDEAMRSALLAYTRFFLKELRRGKEPEQIDGPSTMVWGLHFAQLFYRRYFEWLKRIGFDGALVMHGLVEAKVERRTSLLRRRIRSVLRRDLPDDVKGG
jgi:sugar phosphate isomerase/epimerase